MKSRTLSVNSNKLLVCVLFLLLITENCLAHFARNTIVVAKRMKLGSNNTEKNYCVVTDKDNEDSFFMTSSLRINCSHVPGPIIKLDVGDDDYLRFNREHFIAPGEYCVLKGKRNFGKLCPTNSEPLWRKCCGENEILDATSFQCRQSRIKYRPKVANSLPQSFVIVKNSSTATKNSLLGVKLQCASGFVSKLYSSNPCIPGSNGIFQLVANGTPMYETSSGVFLRKTQLRPVEHESYCIDEILDFSLLPCATFDGSSNDNDHHTRYEDDLDDNKKGSCSSSSSITTDMGEVLLLCMEEQETILNEDGNDDVPKAYFFAALWLSTCPLLLSSAIVNSLVIQKNVHGYILTSYLTSMSLVNINSVVLILDIHIPSASPSPNTEGGCGVLDFTMKFIYLSSLCWMSSMCMNMLRTFSSSLPQVAIESRRFLLSALFSLGFPIIIVMGSYYVGSQPDHETSTLFEMYHHYGGDNNKTKDSTSPSLPPQSQTCRKGTCALYSYKTLPYYSGPIIFLVFCNVAAFLKTSVTIASLRKQAEAVLHKQTKDHLESFALFAKLFLLTGSIWVIRVALLALQIRGLYVTWYGVVLEAVFSIPEVVFPMIIFHHPEFIKWASRKSPMISRVIVKCSPFCRKDALAKDRENSPEFQSANQMSSFAMNSANHQYSMNTRGQALVDATTTTTMTGDMTNALIIEATTV